MFQGLTLSPSSGCCLADKMAQTKCNDLLHPPTNQRGCIPPCAQAQWSYTRHRVGQLVISFVSTKSPATPWRWGHSQSLKCQKTFTSWRSCLPENISLNSFMNRTKVWKQFLLLTSPLGKKILAASMFQICIPLAKWPTMKTKEWPINQVCQIFNCLSFCIPYQSLCPRI